MKSVGSYDWIPTFGKFDVKANEIRFKGGPITYVDPQTNKDTEGISGGKIISDQLFNEGEISAEIEFPETDKSSAAEIIFNYDPATDNHLSAGIIPGPLMFGIRSFLNGKWTTYVLNGDHENLQATKKYNIALALRGSKVTLKLNNVEVLSYTFSFPLKQSQTGLFFFGLKDILVKNYKVQSEKPRVFVVMEFSDKFNELYQDVIKGVCSNEFKLNVIRADEIYGPGLIISDIIEQIKESKVIIADISTLNANVFYEVGYADALNKPTILIAERPVQLPFDKAPFRTLFYENTISGKKKIEDGLRKHLTAILNH